ncbi:MAG: TlyA family RNA methyltransferase [Bdellovibrionaceae bacterium]|nr:TlyA family RNA methyltransferase [Pseudobdellovibrionaceae bacterium]
MRLDVYLLQKKLAMSRSHAQELIKGRLVYQLKNEQRTLLLKSNHQVEEDQADIFVEAGPANRFVSRGGLKLEGALAHTKINVIDLLVLDVGISTGGFTDCLLQSGARAILGVDVGHGQVHSQIKNDPRLKVIEGLNARNIAENSEVIAAMPSAGFDLIVMDVSFISILLIIPQLVPLLKVGGQLLSLVKPQFEVGPEGLGKGGLVKDPGLYSGVEDRVKDICLGAGLTVQDYFASPIEGKDGNKEFFILAKK